MMKTLKFIVLLTVMLVNMTPYIKDGKVEWKANEAAAQYYTIEYDLDLHMYYCRDEADPNHFFYSREMCSLLNYIQPYAISTNQCSSIEKDFGLTLIPTGDSSFGCLIFLASAITGESLESLKNDYNIFTNNYDNNPWDGGTHWAAPFLKRHGVNIGLEVSKTKCEFIGALDFKLKSGVGIFIQQSNHVMMFSEIKYDAESNIGTVKYFDTSNEKEWAGSMSLDDALKVPGQFYLMTR